MTLFISRPGRPIRELCYRPRLKLSTIFGWLAIAAIAGYFIWEYSR